MIKDNGTGFDALAPPTDRVVPASVICACVRVAALHDQHCAREGTELMLAFDL